MKKIFLIVLLFAFSAIAQDQSIVDKISMISDKIPADVSAWVIGVVVFAAELLMRLVPTAKPKSWLLLISGVLKAMSALFDKICLLLDKVIQNIKE